jgi:hypothetical protein
MSEIGNFLKGSILIKIFQDLAQDSYKKTHHTQL